VPRLLVFNKIDRAADARALEASLRERYPDCVVMSARNPADVARLSDKIRAFFEKDLVEAEIFLPWAEQNLRGEIFASCKVLEERADSKGAFLRVRGEAEAVKRLQKTSSGGFGRR